jgi:hypothetical protein
MRIEEIPAGERRAEYYGKYITQGNAVRKSAEPALVASRS